MARLAHRLGHLGTHIIIALATLAGLARSPRITNGEALRRRRKGAHTQDNKQRRLRLHDGHRWRLCSTK